MITSAYDRRGATLDESSRYHAGIVTRWLDGVRNEARALGNARMQARDAYEGMLSPKGVSYQGRDLPGSPNAYGDAIPDGLARVDALMDAMAFVDMELLEQAATILSQALPGTTRAYALAYYLGITGAVGLGSPAYAGPLSWCEMERAFGVSRSTMSLAMRQGREAVYALMPHTVRDAASQALPLC